MFLNEQQVRTSSSASATPHVLQGNTRDFKDPRGPDLLTRTLSFFDWQQARRLAGHWPYRRSLKAAPQTRTQLKDCRNQALQGANFASQDYLSLATTAEVNHVAIEAMHPSSAHSADSVDVIGNTNLSLQLVATLAELLATNDVKLFPTGRATGYGISRGPTAQMITGVE